MKNNINYIFGVSLMIKNAKTYLTVLISLLFVSIVCSQQVTTPTGLTVLPGDTTTIACGDTMLGGYGQMNPPPYQGGHLHDIMWKAFRFPAQFSGEANCFKVFIKGLLGDRTDDEVGFAIYEDNNNTVGPLKVWGYVEHYDWTIIGEWAYHTFIFDRVETDRTITENTYYWITMQSSGREDIYVERGNSNVPGCAQCTKIGAVQYEVYPPPPPNLYNTVYNPNCYGWAVW